MSQIKCQMRVCPPWVLPLADIHLIVPSCRSFLLFDNKSDFCKTRQTNVFVIKLVFCQRCCSRDMTCGQAFLP